MKSRKINIMKTTPEFTEAEIQDMMDFKQVLALTDTERRRSKKIIRRIVTVALVTGLVSGGFFVYQQYSLPEPGAQSRIPDPLSSAADTAQLSISPSAIVPPDTTKQSINTGHTTETDIKKPAKKQPAGAKQKETTSKIRVDSATSVFLPAEPVDGYTVLYTYFTNELRYPQEAIKDSIQGVVSVSFVINAKGKPEQVSTDHSLGEAFDREAIRVIENMPAWKPAQLDGLPVRSKVSVPITFSVKTLRQK